MGAEIKGEISLLILNLSIASIFGSLFGGPSLVYLVPRFSFRNLLIINYGWSILTALIVTVVVEAGFLPSSLSAGEFFFFSLLECLIATHFMLLLGYEQIKSNNWLQILKGATTVFLLLFFWNQGGDFGFVSFSQAYGASLSITFLMSAITLIASRKQMPKSADVEASWSKALSACLTYGSLVQIGNIAQLLNYRLSFYFLELMVHPPSLALIRIGIYSAALQVSEALWQFARSVSTVQYAKVSNLSDERKGLSMSLKLGKLNYTVTALGIIVLLVIPETLYGRVFGAEFDEIKSHFALLSLGILAMSYSNALSHFFAGIGQHRTNTISSVFGLVITAGLGYVAIDRWGTNGAAITASVTYLLQTLYQFYILKKRQNVTWNAVILNRSDILEFWRLIRK